MVSVIHEGVLKLGKKPSSNSSRDWKQFLFVLKFHQDTKRLFLEYYRDANKRWQKQEKKGFIEVLSYCHISLAHNCSFMFPLKITTGSDGDIFLAASTFEAMNKWYNCLQQHCYLVPSATGYYEFLVVVRQSTSTDLIKASGDCVLAFTPQKQIVCAKQTSRQVFGVWPYSSLRKYWGDKELFGFICGRRAPRGEGEFTFKTKQGEDIFRILERLIKVVSARPQEVPVLSSVPSSVKKSGASSQENLYTEENEAGRDARPQQPLPHQVHSKAPELRKRLSLAEPLPPTPGQSSGSTPPGMFPMDSSPPVFQQNSARDTIISDTSPAYGAAPMVPPNRQKSQIHQTPSPPSQGYVKEESPLRKKPFPLPAASPPTSPSRLSEQEEDTYSHTSHDVPVQFVQRNASVKVVRDGSIYHGLVRSDSLGSHKDRKRSESSSPDLDSVAVYDLAYRPRLQNPRELVPVMEGEYESLGDATKQLLQLREKNLPVPADNLRNRENSLSFGERLRHGDDSPDWSAKNRVKVQQQRVRDKENMGGGKANEKGGMQKGDILTENPMYGSKDNIFSDSITDMASSINRERERSISSGSGSGQDGNGSQKEQQAMNDMERSMVMNPVYSECQLPNKRPEQLRGLEGGGIFPGLHSGENHTSKGNDEPLSPLEDSMVDNPMYGGRKEFADIAKQNMYVDPNDDRPLDNDKMEIATENSPNTPAGATSSSSPNSQKLGSSSNTPTEPALPIVRSAKGYTQVDKIASESPNSGEAGSPPPPLPPRLYSESSA